MTPDRIRALRYGPTALHRALGPVEASKLSTHEHLAALEPEWGEMLDEIERLQDLTMPVEPCTLVERQAEYTDWEQFAELLLAARRDDDRDAWERLLRRESRHYLGAALAFARNALAKRAELLEERRREIDLLKRQLTACREELSELDGVAR